MYSFPLLIQVFSSSYRMLCFKMPVNTVTSSLKRSILYTNGSLLWYIIIKPISEECRNILACAFHCCYYPHNYGDISGNLPVARLQSPFSHYIGQGLWCSDHWLGLSLHQGQRTGTATSQWSIFWNVYNSVCDITSKQMHAFKLETKKT